MSCCVSAPAPYRRPPLLFMIGICFWQKNSVTTVAAVREKATRNDKPSPTSGLSQLFMVEGMMIIFLALAFYLLLALLSYSPQDPGWSSTGENETVNNLVGNSGAWLSDVLYLLIGNLAYLLPLLLFYKAYSLFRERQTVSTFNWPVFSMRAAGLVMLLLSSCLLASLHFANSLQSSAGGLLGRSLVSLLLPAFQLVGTTLLALTMPKVKCVCVCICMSTQIILVT